MDKKIYLVGGACRDFLMGKDVKDFDFVAVGYCVDDFKGWEQVGKDFPVFLDPQHGWEVALARVERKTGKTHTDFDAEWNGVTLEQDLLRRDLTMNAIAIEVDWCATVSFGEPITVGTWIDPYGGQQDIKDGIVRKVSNAFSEDPLRGLRVARFLARYPEFVLSSQLEEDLKTMRDAGEFQNLTKERVWMEMEKALEAPDPQRFFEVARNCLGMFDILNWMERTPQPEEHHPEGDVFKHTMLCVEVAANMFGDPEVTFAALCHDFGKPWCHQEYGNLRGHEQEGLRFIEGFCKRWRVPNSYRDLALHTAKQHTKVHSMFGRNGQGWVKPKSIMKMFEETAALTHPKRFAKMLEACEADARGRGKEHTQRIDDDMVYFQIFMPYPQREYLMECLQAAVAVDTKAISIPMLDAGEDGRKIGEAIRVARIDAIRKVQSEWKESGNV